jgi:hypothetical protein
VTSQAPRLTKARRAEHAARDKRLADALRENLRRRKEQVRARQDGQQDTGPDPTPDQASKPKPEGQ